MMSSTKNVLLFGDASGEKLSEIKDLVRWAQSNPAARRFLDDATKTVQKEFSRLSRHDHGWEHGTESLLSIAEQHEAEGGDNMIVSAVLSCIGRLGKLVVSADANPSVLGSPSDPVEVLGFCAGGLPGAVAVAARDTSEVFSLGRDLISVTFILALEGRRRMRLIENSKKKSWGKTYTGLPRTKVKDILDEFHESQKIPKLKRVAMAVVGEDWLTLIAPPSTLAALEEWSAEIRGASQLETEVPGPIHSDNLPQMDVAKVLTASSMLDHPVDLTKARMISPSSFQPRDQGTWGGLLEAVIQDIVYNPLYVKETVEASISSLRRSGGDTQQPSANLWVMGATNYTTPIRAKMKAEGIQYTLMQSAPPSEDDTTDDGERIAIVGMAGRFPGSETVEGFWEDLVAGKCHIKEVPKSRFDLDEWYDPEATGKNSTSARHGAFLDNPGLFDHRLFNISPREAAQIDPGHRLLLTVSYEALQSSGYSPYMPLPGNASGVGGQRVATYFGQVADEWSQVMNDKGVDIYYVPGANRAFGPGRLNFHYKWSGASIALDSACSTSSTAISLACSALIARECDMALAGGVSVALSPITFSGLARAGMLSTTGGCRTFHDDADGYSRGEGAGAVVLKRLKDAIRDNDNILVVIRGWARTYSAEATSITTPSAASQVATYEKVFHQAGVDASEIAYVEMHGTGTQVGDAEEMGSVVAAIGRRHRSSDPVTVGAVKANVGHGEGAAGVTSLIKTILMLRERTIPPQPGWPFKINKKFPPLAQSNVRIPTKPTSLQASSKGGKQIKVLVNSFDASGGNVCLLIQQPPSRPEKPTDPRKWHTVAVSGKTAVSLQQNRERLLDFLKRHPDTNLADLGYTTTARRIHEPLRCAYVGESTRDIVRQLSQDVRSSRQPGAVLPRRPKGDGPKCVFLCTGQGSEYAGNSSQLWKTSRTYRETLDGFQQLTTALGLPHFLDVLCDENLDIKTVSTTKVQLSIVALELAAAHEMRSRGIVPSVVIGHSLGEYVALAIAGVLSPIDALLLVGRRAELIEKQLTPGTHSMLVVNTTAAGLEKRLAELGLDHSCSVACQNAPSITVASGPRADIETLKSSLETDGIKNNLLPVTYGFHSTQLDPILTLLEEASKGIVFHRPRIPVISSLTGRVETEASAFSASYIVRQSRQMVKFVQALEAGRENGLLSADHLYYEMGPNPTLLGLASQALSIPSDHLLPVFKRGEDNWLTNCELLKRTYEMGGAVNWHEFHAGFQKHLSLLDLPTYAFDSKDYWIPYPARERQLSLPQSCQCSHEGSGKVKVDPDTKPEHPRLSQSSLHCVKDQKVDNKIATATFTSSVYDPHIWGAIRGHIVNGRIVCPMAVFHDFASSAAKYLYRLRFATTDKLPSMSIKMLNMTNALVLDEATAHDPDLVVEVTAAFQTDSNLVDIEFHSRNIGDSVQTKTSHGTCQVLFEHEHTWKKAIPSLQHDLFLVRSRMSALTEQAAAGKAHSLLKPVLYALFSSVVSYAPGYQAIQSVVMDSSSVDAIATVKLDEGPDTAETGRQFHQNPFWSDALLHISGFLVNNTLRYPIDTVCLANGYDCWRSSGHKLTPGETYTTYAVMQDDLENDHIISGECYVFHGNDLVLMASGIRFVKVKRVALDLILGCSNNDSMVVASRQVTDATPALPMKQQRTLGRDGGPGLQETAETSHFVYMNKISQKKDNDTGLSRSDGIESSRASEVDIAGIITSTTSLLAAETGCTVEDITDDTRFADLGIDSVMGITVLAMIKRKVGVELPAAFFMDNETIGEFKEALEDIIRARLGPQVPRQLESVVLEQETSSSDESIPFSTPMSSSTAGGRTPEAERETIPYRPLLDHSSPKLAPQSSISSQSVEPSLVAKVTHYQGARSAISHKLFFVADETGSTFPYISLPSLGTNLNLGVYGVDSPLLSFKDQNDLTQAVTVRLLAEAYRTAIKKEQPEGPYLVGGLSLGAVLACEVARAFIAHGDEVAGLIILDCAMPSPAKALSTASSSPGGKRALMKPAQKAHFQNIAALMKDYQPVPLPVVAQGKPHAHLVLAAGHMEVMNSRGTQDKSWEDVVPRLQMHDSGVESGSFLRMPKSKGTVRMLKEILEGMLA